MLRQLEVAAERTGWVANRPGEVGAQLSGVLRSASEMGVQRGLYPCGGSAEIVGLIDRYGRGDQWAGEQLEMVVRSLLSRRIRRCDVSQQEADELIQESIFQVFSRIGEYCESKGNFDAWISGFAMNSVRAHRRRETRTRTTSIPVEDTFELSYEIAPHDGERQLLSEAINTLDLIDRELLHMRFSLGMSSDEIAKNSNLNAPQVRKRISRAMERLRRHPSIRQVLL